MTEQNTDISTQLAAGLAKIGLVLRHHSWEKAGRRGLNPTQAQILAVLRERACGLSEVNPGSVRRKFKFQVHPRRSCLILVPSSPPDRTDRSRPASRRRCC